MTVTAQLAVHGAVGGADEDLAREAVRVRREWVPG